MKTTIFSFLSKSNNIKNEIIKNNFEKVIKVNKRNPFNNKQFWESKYQTTNEPLNWYILFEEFYKKLGYYFSKKDNNILNVGAGNSEISERLYFEGFKRIINIDYSKEVVMAMTKRYQTLNYNIPYFEMDMRMLIFDESIFDIVLDLGGSDCLLCSRSPLSDYKDFSHQVHKVLKENGIYIRITLFKNLEKYDIKQYYDESKFELKETFTTDIKGDRVFVFKKKELITI